MIRIDNDNIYITIIVIGKIVTFTVKTLPSQKRLFCFIIVSDFSNNNFLLHNCFQDEKIRLFNVFHKEFHEHADL